MECLLMTVPSVIGMVAKDLPKHAIHVLLQLADA
jgi:hypothetical protein